MSLFFWRFFRRRAGGGISTGEQQGLLEACERHLGSFYCRHACGRCEADCPDGVPVRTLLCLAHSQLTMC